MEAMSLKKWRLKVTKDLRGKVLEVGVGTKRIYLIIQIMWI